jgi:hypothetical protein
MFSSLNEAVNKLMDGFFQQQEENRRLHKRCDELQEELREMKARLLIEFERRIEHVEKDLSNKLEKLTVNQINTFSEQVLIGYVRGIPVIVHKNCDIEQLFQNFVSIVNVPGTNSNGCYLHNCELIVENLKYLKNIFFDPARFLNITLIDKNRVISPGSFRKSSSEGYSLCCWHYGVLQYPEVKIMYKLCKENGIKFKILGKDRLNGVPVKLLFEDAL